MTSGLGPMGLRALRLLRGGPLTASALGGKLWVGKAPRFYAPVTGGGCFTALMLLGRLRRRGLVEHVRQEDGEPNPLWRLTSAGLAADDKAGL